MKNKGIVIELTALLDVILIMLFWLMMSLRNTSDNIRADAEERISKAEQQVKSAEESASEAESRADKAVAEMEKMQTELEEVRENADREIAEAWKKAASINDNAAANQYALDRFERGFLITVNLRYDADTGVLISDNNGDSEQADVTIDDISSKLTAYFESSGFGQNDVILCAMTYDGSQALYRDVRTLRTAVYHVKENYPNLYCTYINTKER